MNYLVLFTVLVLSSCAYVAESWFYPGLGLGYGLGGYYGLGYGLGGYYGGLGYGYGLGGLGYGLGWRGYGFWGKRDAEFIPRVDCIFKKEKNTLVCNGIECETLGGLGELKSKYSMFGIGREVVGVTPVKYRLYPKGLSSVVFADSEFMNKFNKMSSVYLSYGEKVPDQCGLVVKSQECYDKFVGLFRMVKNDFKDKMISFKNESVDISLYGSIVIE